MRSHRRRVEDLLERIADGVDASPVLIFLAQIEHSLERVEHKLDRNHSDHVALLRAIKKEGELMSVLSDKITEVGASVDAATTRVVNDIAALNAKIAELQALVDAGGATAEDIAALDALKVKLDQIDPATPTTI